MTSSPPPGPHQITPPRKNTIPRSALVVRHNKKAHGYTKRAKRAPHIARGDGLHAATTGVPTSFHIDLFEDGGRAKWSPGFNQFIYVWIASKDQVTGARVRAPRLRHFFVRLLFIALVEDTLLLTQPSLLVGINEPPGCFSFFGVLRKTFFLSRAKVECANTPYNRHDAFLAAFATWVACLLPPFRLFCRTFQEFS